MLCQVRVLCFLPQEFSPDARVNSGHGWTGPLSEPGVAGA